MLSAPMDSSIVLCCWPPGQPAMSQKTIDYDTVAAAYDAVRSGDPEMVHQLLDGLNISPGMKALDVGCGTGNNTLLFARSSGLSVTGLDLSYGMLCQAARKIQEVPLVLAPADHMPFTDASFDFVYMTEVIHHLPDPAVALNEIWRVLRTDGQACIVTQSHKQIAGRMTSRFFPSTVTIDQARYPSIQSLKTALAEAGFGNIILEPYTFAAARLGLDYLRTVEHKGYSMLHRISDQEYATGLNRLRSALESDEELDYAAGYTFVWAARKLR
jgi:ubiquinone/menaquinone biosynthesis C-methylase UbiE